jgi:ABC-type antimicrobial peptide transport system permease subunit
MATLSGAFGILAVALATVGLYGVISYLVTRRRSEIGIRIALGADRGRVIFLVLREAMLLLGIGVVVGVVISVWVGRTAATLLYGLKPYDPVSLIGACLLLAGIALAASYVPARRAAALEPMVALRDE